MLQEFIYINIFAAGVALTLLSVYAYVHFTKKNEGTPVHSDPPRLPDKTRAELMERAESRFKAIIDHAAGEMQFDLKDTSDAVSTRLKNLGQSISDAEMHRYQASLQQIRNETEHTFRVAAEEVAKHQTELKNALETRRKELEAALEQDIALEKQRFIDSLDKKLSGAITSFLLETLGHDVDLGAQSAYLIKTLEENKTELIKELSDESGS